MSWVYVTYCIHIKGIMAKCFAPMAFSISPTQEIRGGEGKIRGSKMDTLTWKVPVNQLDTFHHS